MPTATEYDGYYTYRLDFLIGCDILFEIKPLENVQETDCGHDVSKYYAVIETEKMCSNVVVEIAHVFYAPHSRWQRTYEYEFKRTEISFELICELAKVCEYKKPININSNDRKTFATENIITKLESIVRQRIQKSPRSDIGIAQSDEFKFNLIACDGGICITSSDAQNNFEVLVVRECGKLVNKIPVNTIEEACDEVLKWLEYFDL